MDGTAIALCKENNIPIRVFNLFVQGNIIRAVKGENVGTIVGGLK
jgi:uridylate kinase